MDRGAKSRREQQHGKDFVEAAETASVRLDEVDGRSLHELLEHNTVCAVLAGRNRNIVFAKRAANGCVAKNIIW